MKQTRIAAPFIALALCGGVPAAAQEQPADYEAIVRVMRGCARIADMAARVACYDSTVGAEQLMADAATVPERGPPVEIVSPPTPDPRLAVAPPRTKPAPPASFGAEALPQPREVQQERERHVQLAVSGAQNVEPGIYVLTLEDGSQWRFVDAVPPSYDPPRSGEHIELARGALGSFRMSYADQRAVRIRRVR